MDTDTTAAPADGGEPIPTDELGLLGYLAALPPGAQIDVADRLAIQLGGTPEAIGRAADMVSSALAELAHEKEIEQERAAFAGRLNAATAAVEAARRSLNVLTSDEVYDIEYAEGGVRVDHLRAFLGDAGRMLAAAVAMNPCPPAPARGQR